MMATPDEQNKDNAIRQDETSDFFVRTTFVKPLPPKSFRIEKAQNGVRCFAGDRGRTAPADGRLSGSVAYRVRWAESLILTDHASVDAAFTRSVVLAPAIEPSGKDGIESVAFYQDPKYASGWFFCTGVDASGTESADYAGPLQLTSQILDDSVPPDPTHVQISGSGEYIGSDVIEAISVSLQTPRPNGSFDGVQLFLKDYITLGSMQEGEFHRYGGAPGGSMQFKVNYEVAKRIGTGTITLNAGSTAVTGTKFLQQAQAGDVVECGGVRRTIQTVNSDTSITLTVGWPGAGPTVAAYTDYCFYAKVTIYAVAISKGGTHRSDVTNAPSASVVFDGSLGTPNAPTITATSAGNVIRLEFQAVVGTAIRGYRICRAPGTGVPFSIAAFTFFDEIPQPKNVTGTTQSLVQFEDSSFTAYDKEIGQAFTYFVFTVNERGDMSVASNGVDAVCRLDSASDADPSIPGRSGYKNMFFNAMFAGTAAGNVVDTDTAQDANHFTFVDGGYTPGTPGKPFHGGVGVDGTGRWKGYTRWHSTKTGAATLATFQNGNEILLPAPGVDIVYVYQEIGAWDDGRAQYMKARKNGFVAFQIKLRKKVGSSPSGSIKLRIEQYNNDTLTGQSKRRYRDSSSVPQFYTGTAADLIITGSQLTEAWQIFYAIYQYDAALGTTKQIRFTIEHNGSSAGGDVYMCDPMINDGQELGLWTPEMGDPYISMPVPGTPPGGISDGDGHRNGTIKIP